MQRVRYLLIITIYDHWFYHQDTIYYYSDTKRGALAKLKRYKELTSRGGGLEIINHSVSKVLG